MHTCDPNTQGTEQEDHKFEASLGYTGNSLSKQQQ